jgi:chromosome segregation ATPase
MPILDYTDSISDWQRLKTFNRDKEFYEREQASEKRIRWLEEKIAEYSVMLNVAESTNDQLLEDLHTLTEKNTALKEQLATANRLAEIKMKEHETVNDPTFLEID